MVQFNLHRCIIAGSKGAFLRHDLIASARDKQHRKPAILNHLCPVTPLLHSSRRTDRALQRCSISYFLDIGCLLLHRLQMRRCEQLRHKSINESLNAAIQQSRHGLIPVLLRRLAIRKSSGMNEPKAGKLLVEGFCKSQRNIAAKRMAEQNHIMKLQLNKHVSHVLCIQFHRIYILIRSGASSMPSHIRSDYANRLLQLLSNRLPVGRAAAIAVQQYNYIGYAFFSAAIPWMRIIIGKLHSIIQHQGPLCDRTIVVAVTIAHCTRSPLHNPNF
ncbi:hypothetical protein D3C78_1034340 [compost metagenome]